MARSTGIVLAAGGIVLADQALGGWDAAKGVKTFAATVLATFAAGALDAVIPGLGTGTAVVLLVGVVLHTGPSLLGRLGLIEASQVKTGRTSGVNLDAAARIARGN